MLGDEETLDETKGTKRSTNANCRKGLSSRSAAAVCRKSGRVTSVKVMWADTKHFYAQESLKMVRSARFFIDMYKEGASFKGLQTVLRFLPRNPFSTVYPSKSLLKPLPSRALSLGLCRKGMKQLKTQHPF